VAKYKYSPGKMAIEWTNSGGSRYMANKWAFLLLISWVNFTRLFLLQKFKINSEKFIENASGNMQK
jgi:hypothetical protein